MAQGMGDPTSTTSNNQQFQSRWTTFQILVHPIYFAIEPTFLLIMAACKISEAYDSPFQEKSKLVKQEEQRGAERNDVNSSHTRSACKDSAHTSPGPK